ncbi:MAG: hypothetical protein AAFQ82_06000 [Myxococcota bacterium]
MMTDVRALHASDVDVDTAVRWVRAMTHRGVYSHNTGRMRATALEQLAAMLEPDDARDAQTVLDRLPELADLWAAERMRRPETAAAYLRRARAGLKDFIAFRAAPGAFKPSVKKRPPSRRAPSARPEKKRSNEGLRDCPLGDGRSFHFKVPEGWCLADVERVIAHLATLARDFRPDWTPGAD